MWVEKYFVAVRRCVCVKFAGGRERCEEVNVECGGYKEGGRWDEECKEL